MPFSLPKLEVRAVSFDTISDEREAAAWLHFRLSMRIER
jgi:hypothetical protein